VRIATLSNAAVVHTVRWATHLRERGHDVRVYSLEPAAPGFDARILPAAPLPGVLRYPLAVGALKRALAEFRPQLIDAHYVPNYGVMGVLSGQRPLCVTAWGSDLLIAGKRDAFQRARAKWVMRRADLVLADSDNLAAAALELGAPRESVRAVPWGVDRGRFIAGARERGLLLSTRMHESIYDIPVLLRGVARVMAARPEVFLALAGDGSLRATHEGLAAQLLPAGRYRFLGRLVPAEMAQWLGRAEIMLSASQSDSTSVSLLESMAAGAIPVVSDLEGNREWVQDGVGARCFAVGDDAALSRALEAALAGDAWREQARAHNAEVIAERGDWMRNMRHIEEMFEQLVAGQPLSTHGRPS
jgi:glycosyltransferase involved in cell wall biosynthesis